ncbi:bifunctional diguanylate cyclase/phosphodiesterase [Actinoplanes sp. NPDC051851]|uniref:putative bifunctional diguanylate cyclase/phosphodiesterase n=1 Tax=Actinoplanes sp. NPDC051851 TaxID=3154753 RepID=UPI0034181705
MGAIRARVAAWRPRPWVTALLATTLAVLSGLALLDAGRHARIVDELSAVGSQVTAYQEAAYLSATELSLIQASLAEPYGIERARLLGADRQTYEAMRAIAETEAEFAMQAGLIAVRQLNLRPQIENFLGQLDRGDRDAARVTLATMLEPAYGRIAERLGAMKNVYLARYRDRLASAEHDSAGLLRASLTTFGLSLVVLALFGWSSRAYRHAVERLAATDVLTGLPNRTAFTAHVQRALTAGPAPSVLIVNIDGFRYVNDQLGPRVGDLLLSEAGRRLAASVRSTDVVSRLGGDDFAVLLLDSDPAAAPEIAARLHAAFDESFLLDDVTVDLEVSVGAATAGPDDDLSTLLGHADTAMREAKEHREGFRAYVGKGQDGDARLTLLGDLRRGMDDPDQLTLHYQPKIALATGEMIGVEALARWTHPVTGPISPGQFIPVVESTGLIHRFTDRVLDIALRQAGAWLTAGHRVPVAVNVSTRSLLDPTFPERVGAALLAAGVPGELLCVEVTEHSVMSDPSTAIEALRRIRELGVKTSIDDYGTGYSSMSYLRLLPADELKIDRSFVMGITADAGSRALVASTVDLGHSLGLVVVAEGIEDQETADALTSLGCDTAQGYHFARPMPAADLTARLGAELVTSAG